MHARAQVLPRDRVKERGAMNVHDKRTVYLPSSARSDRTLNLDKMEDPLPICPRVPEPRPTAMSSELWICGGGCL